MFSYREYDSRLQISSPGIGGRRGAQLEQDSQTTTHTPELGSAFQRRGRALASLSPPNLFSPELGAAGAQLAQDSQIENEAAKRQLRRQFCQLPTEYECRDFS